MDRGGWRATVHRVTQSLTQLKGRSTHASSEGTRWTRFCLNGILYIQEVHNLPSGGLVASSSPVQLCATPWKIAHQVPLSMGISTQEFWSGLKFPSPGDLPDPEIEPSLLQCSQILYRLSHQGIKQEVILNWPDLIRWAY